LAEISRDHAARLRRAANARPAETASRSSPKDGSWASLWKSTTLDGLGFFLGRLSRSTLFDGGADHAI
jgi:hypothetical protein